MKEFMTAPWASVGRSVLLLKALPTITPSPTACYILVPRAAVEIVRSKLVRGDFDDTFGGVMVESAVTEDSKS
jgi:hypothetical protein